MESFIPYLLIMNIYFLYSKIDYYIKLNIKLNIIEYYAKYLITRSYHVNQQQISKLYAEKL